MNIIELYEELKTLLESSAPQDQKKLLGLQMLEVFGRTKHSEGVTAGLKEARNDIEPQIEKLQEQVKVAIERIQRSDV